LKAIKLLGNEKSQMVEVKEPTPIDDEVIVKMESLALCGSCIKLRFHPSKEEGEKKTADIGLIYDFNSIPGHEISGTILNANKSKKFKKGDRVFIFPFIANKESVFYKEKLYKYATPIKIIGYTVDGGNTELLSVPEINCYKLPDYVSFDQGAMLLDPVGAPFGAIKKLAVDSKESVLILGTGPIGLGATVICEFLGIKKIIGVDRVKERTDLAKELGAHIVFNKDQKDIHEDLLKITGGKGPDVVLDCIGDKDSFNTAMNYVKPQGKVGVIGEPGFVNNVSVSDILIHKDLNIVGSWVYDPEKLKDLTDLIKDGMKIEKIITHSFNLSDSVKAWDVFNTYKTGKVIIKP